MSTVVRNNNEYKETHDVDKWNKLADIINKTTKKPTIVNAKSKFVIITYWWGRGNKNKNTRKPCYDPDAPIEKEAITYEEMIKNWENACMRANCNFLAVEYPEFAVPGGYQLAINAKPLFIKKAIELCEGRGVVYIDGDMPVRKYPHVFDMENYDFMARHWNIDPRSSKHYKNSVCIDSTIFETSGGIMYFNSTFGSYRLLDNWIFHTFYKINMGKADDRILSLIMGNKLYTYQLRIFLLPVEYLWLSDLYDAYLKNAKNNIIIEHPECLTTEELAQEQGAANNREPKFYTKVVTDYIECSKFGGFFWEHIFFENEKQLATFKPYLSYLKSITIDDAYEARDSDDIEKPPYYFVEYNDKYGTFKFDGETFQSIADGNKKLTEMIYKVLMPMHKAGNISFKKIVYVMHKDGKQADDIYIDSIIDIDSNKIIYTNHVNCTIIALLKLGYEVIFLPSLTSTMYVNLINSELYKNSDLELIFANTHGYIIDAIKFVDNTPIYLKNGRILMHMLHLIKDNSKFLETFSRVFKSSHHFLYCIRVGLYNYKPVQRKTAKMESGITYLSLEVSKSNSKGSKNSKSSKSSKGSKNSKGSKSSKSSKSSKGSKNSKSNEKSDIMSDQIDDIDKSALFKTIFKRLSIARRRGEHQKKKEQIDATKK